MASVKGQYVKGFPKNQKILQFSCRDKSCFVLQSVFILILGTIRKAVIVALPIASESWATLLAQLPKDRRQRGFRFVYLKTFEEMLFLLYLFLLI